MLTKAGVGQRPGAVAGAALALLWLALGTGLAVWFSGRIQDWSVMTDELLYAKLATSIAETGSPLPQVHGASVSVYNQLYPLLLAPLFGTLSPPDAFRAGHVLNAFLMTSAVVPRATCSRARSFRARGRSAWPRCRRSCPGWRSPGS